MGYMKHKYNKAYVLHEYKAKPCGIAGMEFFIKGKLRTPDRILLDKIDFDNKNVLEIGFGRGEAIKYAKEKGAKNVTGVDFSKDAYNIANEYLNKYNIKSELYCEDILIFIKKYITKNINMHFDIISMLDVIEHIPRNEVEEILNLLPLISNKNFIIIIHTPFYEIDNDIISEGLKEKARDPADDYEETSGMHCNRYSKESLIKFMNYYNYKVANDDIHYFIKE